MELCQGSDLSSCRGLAPHRHVLHQDALGYLQPVWMTMTDSSDANKGRNREIAQNEEAKQITGSIRVSISAVAVAVIIGGLLFAFGWLALK
jgi:hypothetical protein